MGCGSSKDVVENHENSKQNETKQDSHSKPNKNGELTHNNNVVINIEPPREAQSKGYTTGDRVHVRGYVGTIKFTGKTKLGEGEWIGVELDKPHPQGNNGAFGDEIYFACKPKHGLIVRPEAVRAHDEELSQDLSNISPASIVLIQAKMRTILAKIRMKKLRERSESVLAIDKHAMSTPAEEEESPNRLGIYLTEPYSKDKDKAYSIYRWLTLNIAYDVDGFFGRDSKKSCSAEDVLKNKLSVCSGYANLFKAMGKAAGLEIEVVSGYAKGYGYKPGQRIQGSNHAWNALRIDDKWYLSDATWGAGHVGNDMMFHREPNSYRFLMDPEYAILDHLPEDEKWQCMDEPVSKEIFERSAVISGAMHSMGVVLESHKQLSYNIDSASMEMTLYCPGSKNKLMGKVKDKSGQTLPGRERVRIRSSGVNQVTITAQFPAPGCYTVEIYVHVNDSWTHGVTYVITTTSGCGQGNGGFPQISQHFHDSGLALVNPWENIETNNGKADIKIECYNKRFVSIFGNVHGEGESEKNMVKNLCLCYSETTNNGFVVKVDTPGPGIYTLNIFGKDETGKSVFLCKYYINNTEKDKREVVGFPRLSDQLSDLGLTLVEPFESIITSDGQAEIKLKGGVIPSASFTASLQPDSSVQLKLEQNQQLCLCEKSDDILTVKVDAPKRGLYTLNIFGNQNPSDNASKMTWLCTHKIYSKVEDVRPVFGFARLSDVFMKWELQLEEARNIHSHDGNVQIVLKCPNSNVAGLLCNLSTIDKQTINSACTVTDNADKQSKVISIKLPQTGLFNLNVFGKKEETDTQYIFLCSYVIYSDKGSLA